MKLIRSSKCSTKFATESKKAQLREVLAEYGKVCNIFKDFSEAELITRVFTEENGFTNIQISCGSGRNR